VSEYDDRKNELSDKLYELFQKVNYFPPTIKLNNYCLFNTHFFGLKPKKIANQVSIPIIN